MTFSEQFKEVFELICDKMGVAIDWTQENVVPYVTELCERYVTFNIIEEIISVVCWSLIIIGCIVGAIVIVKDFKKVGKEKGSTHSLYWIKDVGYCGEDWDLTFFGYASAIIGAVLFIVSIPFLIFSISELLKWCFIPEVQIIEEISILLKAM